MADDWQALREVDAEIEAAIGVPQSLCPERARATRLRALAPQVSAWLGDAGGALPAAALGEGIARIGRAQLRHFPDNVFWDLDYVVGSLAREAVTSGDPVGVWDARCRQVERLDALFGVRSVIHFQYVHDFVYGFDWSRWVQRDPDARRGQGPFAGSFLDELERRGADLCARIKQGDDPRYGPLPAGTSRNPFGFNRTPEAETALHEDLARTGWIPVAAWSLEATPQWERPYHARREERARALGLER